MDSSDDEGGFERPVVGVAVANFDFTARKPTELSFHKGDVINIFLMVCCQHVSLAHPIFCRLIFCWMLGYLIHDYV